MTLTPETESHLKLVYGTFIVLTKVSVLILAVVLFVLSIVYGFSEQWKDAYNYLLFSVLLHSFGKGKEVSK